MSNQEGLAGFGQRWVPFARVVGALVAIAALLNLGTVLYDEVWQRKHLAYTTLPTYDLGTQVFAGLVVENRGMVTLTDVQIIISDLEAPVAAIHMPGPHEPAYIARGGVGDTETVIRMRRLSRSGSLPVYMLTAGPISLEWGKTLFVSSAETVGVASAEEAPQWRPGVIAAIIGSLGAAIGIMIAMFYWIRAL